MNNETLPKYINIEFALQWFYSHKFGNYYIKIGDNKRIDFAPFGIMTFTCPEDDKFCPNDFIDNLCEICRKETPDEK